MTDLVRIPFHDTDLVAAVVDDVPMVALKPMCTAIGLAYSKQLQKLRSKPWATVSLRDTVAADGKSRGMAMIDRRTMTMWLATVDPSRVADETRGRLIAYQCEAADALDRYFHEGGAVNPRADADQLARIAGLAQAQMAVLEAGRNLLPAGWLEAKAKIVASRALGEVPQVDEADLPLYVDDYLRSMGLGKSQVVALRSPFGRRLASVYRSVRGCPPGKAPATVGGRPREVNVYFGRDRGLFDRVWSDHYADAFDAEAVAS